MGVPKQYKVRAIHTEMGNGRAKSKNPDHVAARLAKQQRKRDLDAWRAFRDQNLKPYTGNDGTAMR